MDAKDVVNREIDRAKGTWIFEHPDHDHYVVLSHPGQPAPKVEPTFLRENFGIMPQHANRQHIKLLVDSDRHRPRPLDEIALERAGGRRERIQELRAELARLLAEEGVEADEHPSAGDPDAEPEPEVPPVTGKGRSAAKE